MYQPTHIFYMNTIQCNQRCTKCSHWKYKDQADRLPASRLIDAMLKLPYAKELCIVGGEPLLFKNEIFEILKGISPTEIRTVLVTNGVPMDKAFIDQIRSYNVHIVVSIDTMDKEFWQFVRGANSYDRVFAHVEYAASQLESHQLSLQSVLSKETQPHIGAVGIYARSKGLFHSIQDYISDGFEGNWTPLEHKQAFVPEEEQQCYAADRNLSIMQNGDVFTCFQQSWISGCEKPLGNLNEDSIDNVLSSTYALEIAEKMRVCNLPCKVLKCNTRN